MNKLTDQSAFTKAAKGLLDQMVPSRTYHTQSCMHRTFKDGKLLCCGIGFLVSDELASLMDKEGDSSVGAVMYLEEVQEVLGQLDIKLLKGIQEVHDEYAPEEWEERLKCVAKTHKLIWEL